MLIPNPGQTTGGVTVSTTMVLSDSFFWTEKRINQTLEDTMGDAFHKVHQTALRLWDDMRTGAYILATDRVAEATRVRGYSRKKNFGVRGLVAAFFAKSGGG